MYNTGNPVPSAALEDMADNAQTFDALVTKTEGTTTDRKGVNRRVFQQILMDMGFQPLEGSFQTGATITARNQTLYDEASHVFYAWGGAIPAGGYVVPAGSTPATAGGTGVGAWSDKTDLMLRSDINIVQKRFACVADMVADTSLTVGKIVESIGYRSGWEATNKGPKGGNRYEIVAGGTGVSDGGSFISLSNGLQAKGLFINGVSLSQFGGYLDGLTDDSSFLNNAASFVSASGIKNLNIDGTAFLASGLLDLSGYNDVTYTGGKLLGENVSSQGQPSTSIKIWGSLGADITYTTMVPIGVRSFTVNNTLSAKDLVLLSNYPTDATDTYTESAANVFGEKYRFYSNVSSSNLRQTRRKEPLRIQSANASSFITTQETAYNYGTTSGLKFNKINAVKNVRFDCDIENIYLYFKYCDSPVLTGEITSSFVAFSTCFEPVFTPKHFNSNSTDCRVDMFAATRAPKISGIFSGMNGAADNSLVKLLGTIDVDVDVICNGSYSAAYFSHGVMIDTEFVEASDGYPSLPATGGNVIVSGCGMTGYLVSATCDPFASKVEGINFNVSGKSETVQAKGVSRCSFNGVCNALSIGGCEYSDFSGLSRQAADYEFSITDSRSGVIRYNSHVYGVWQNWTPSIKGSVSDGSITYSLQQGRMYRDKNIVTVSGTIIWSGASGFSGNIRIGGFPFTSVNSSAISIGEYSGLTSTNGITAKLDQGAATAPIFYNGIMQQSVPPSGVIGFNVTYETN